MMATWLEEHGVELVVLAGYMHLLTKPFLDRFPGAVVNVHPSLLPAFPGTNAIEDALAAGVETTGVTVHYVDEGVDTGPVIRQEAVRSSRARRSRSGSTRSSTGCCPRSSPRSSRRGLAHEGADLGLGQGRASTSSRAGSPTSATSSSRPAAPRRSSRSTASTVTRVEEVTAAPEMLGGRVKTLHPRIHAGILARRDLQEDVDTLAAHEIEPFDLVCVNLYPVRVGRRAARRDRGRGDRDDRRRRPVDAPRRGEELRARDPGVPARAVRPRARRAARRRHARRTTRGTCSRRRRSRRRRRTTRRSRAWFGDIELFPQQLTLSFQKVADLSYGENPHQRAAYYAEEGLRRHLLSRVEQLGGKELSYNNLADLEGARRVVREFTLPAAVIVKHGNPCGVAVAGSIEEAYELRARGRSGLGVRLRARAQPAGRRRARRADRGALRRGAARARLRRRRDRGAAREARAAAALRPRAPHGDARRARLQARARRPARAGARRRRRRPPADDASSPAA